MNLAYITNIDLKEASGGGSGVNYAAFNQLSKYFDLESIYYINSGNDYISKIISKSLRMLNKKGNYHFYSDKRLSTIARKVDKISVDDTDAFFFNGFTPWIKSSPKVPYYCYNDACFATYIEIYNDKSKFSNSDLWRIMQLEKQWLSNAERVFFRSQWAMEEAKRNYEVDGRNFVNVGLGGFIDIPEEDVYDGGLNFLFISREFLPKGGDIAVAAIEIVQEKFPEAVLWIVGEKPMSSILAKPGIEYKGFFNKSIKSDIRQLQKIFSKTFALIHPTLKDINSLVITELSYFGCPTISTNAFAIPEYVIDHKTGFLLENPRNPEEIAEKMMNLIENKFNYLTMRNQARRFSTENNTWELVGERLKTEILT